MPKLCTCWTLNFARLQPYQSFLASLCSSLSLLPPGSSFYYWDLKSFKTVWPLSSSTPPRDLLLEDLNVVHAPTALAPPGSRLEMQTLRPHPRPAPSESPTLGQMNSTFQIPQVLQKNSTCLHSLHSSPLDPYY